MKKIISVFLAFVMLIGFTSSMGVTAFAEEVNHYLPFQAEMYSGEVAGFDDIFIGTDSSSFARTLYGDLHNDPLFCDSVDAWSYLHIVDSPGYIISNSVFQMKDLYDAILFDMVNPTKQNTFYNSFDSEFNKLYKMIVNERSSFVVKTSNMIMSKENVSANDIKIKNLSDVDAKLLLEGTKYANVTSVASDVTNILKKAKYTYDAIKNVADYLAIKDIDYGTSEILRTMAADTKAPDALRVSANEIADSMTNGYGKAAVAIVEGSSSGLSFALNLAVDKAWSSVLAVIPGANAVAFGTAAGRMLVDYLFKTESTIKGYYQLKATVDIEDSLIRIMNDKSSSTTTHPLINAAQYMKAVDMYKSIILLGFDYSISLLNTAGSSTYNTATDFWLGNSTECEKLVEQIKSFKDQKVENFERYENVVFDAYKRVYFPNYDVVETELNKIPIAELTVTQTKTINVGDSGLISDFFSFSFAPEDSTETGKVESVASSDESVISISSDIGITAHNAGKCSLVFSYNGGLSKSIEVHVVCKTRDVGDKITLGSYPKTLVKDENIIDELNSLNLEWKSYDYYSGDGTIFSITSQTFNKGGLSKYLTMSKREYMKYVDVTFEGEKYRGVRFNEYRPTKTFQTNDVDNSYQKRNNYFINNVYWFKYEPLNWYLLDKNTGLSICEDIIDSQSYENEIFEVKSFGILTTNGNYANSYDGSSLRSFLNNSFYDTAFNSRDKGLINCQDYAKSIYVSVLNTNDTPLLKDASIDYSCFSSDYAKSQGVYVANAKSKWWIYNDKVGYYTKVQYYNTDGIEYSISVGDSDVCDTSIGVRPVINISKDLINSFDYNNARYEYNDDGTCRFVEQKNLTDEEVDIPANVYGYKVSSIGYMAFKNCKNLKRVTIPKSITKINSSFDGCSNLSDVYYSGTKKQWNNIDGCIANPIIHCSDGGIFNDRVVTIDNFSYKLKNDNTADLIGYKGELVNINIPKTISYAKETLTVNKIESKAFMKCTTLKSITIPDSVTSIGDSAFYGCESLIDLIIPESVTSIGAYGFYGCKSLTSIIIPKKVTSIDYATFYGCTNLTSITIPKKVTSISSRVFYDCSSLTDVFYSGTKKQWKLLIVDVDSGEFFTSAVVHCSDGITFKNKKINQNNIKYVLKDENSAYVVGYYDNPISIKILDKITYGGINVPVTTIESYAFTRCKSLTNIIIPDGVTSIGCNAFEDCSNLTSVTIPKSVTSIDNYAFCGCDSLTSVTIPEKVTNIGNWAFYNCVNITSITIPNSVTNIGEGVFSDCKGLTSATIGNSVTGISNKAFEDCSNLTSVTIGNSVTSIGDFAFDGCYNLISVIIPNNVTSIGKWAFASVVNLKNVFYDGTITQWESINIGTENSYLLEEPIIKCTDGIIGNGNTITLDNLKYQINNDYTASIVGYQNAPDILVIPDNIFYEGYKFKVINISSIAFINCKSLTSLTIGNNVTSINNSAFNDCSNLISVIMPNSVTSIDNSAFKFCSNLKKVFYNGTIAQWKSINVGTDNSSLVEEPIIKCTDGIFVNGNTIIIDNIKYQINNDYTASIVGYQNAPNIIVIPENISYEGYKFKVKSIGNDAFRGCESLISVTIENGIIDIGEHSFEDCTNLTSVKIGNDIKSIGKSAFSYCTNLTSVTIGNSVTNIGDSAFYNCQSLKNVTIPDKVTNIGNWVFYFCTSLSNVTVGSGVTSIGYHTFDNCQILTDVYYNGSQKEWNKIAIGYNNESLENSTIHYNFVPCSENKHNAFGEWEIVKEATCTSDGLKKRVCAYDGYSETEKIDKINHNYKKNIVEPTCITQGYTVYTCTECGNTYKGDYVATVEHSFKDYKYNNDATCTTDGTKTATCEYGCGTTDTVTAPNTAKGHKFVENEKYCINGCKTLNPNYKDPTPTPSGGSTGGGSTDPTPAPGGGGGGGAIPAPIPDETDKKDDNKKPETKPSEPTKPSATKKPAAVKVNKLNAKKKALVVYWSKVNGVDGYYIQLATDKKFKKNRKYVIVAKQNASKETVKKLKKNKKYYVRVRSYKIVNGKKVYGKWSKVKSVKTK